jgi:hypothetical protein
MDQVTVVNVKWTGNYKHVLDTPRSVAPATGWSLCGLGPTGWAYSWSEAEGVYLANVSLNTCKKCMKALRAKRTPVPAGQPKIRMSFTAAEVLSLAAFARAYTWRRTTPAKPRSGGPRPRPGGTHRIFSTSCTTSRQSR